MVGFGTTEATFGTEVYGGDGSYEDAAAAAKFEEEESARYNYENSLVDLTQNLLNVYTYSEVPILLLGAIGHVLSLLTMFKSKNMQTPSFFYHRCLTISELAYIVDCFAQKGFDYFYKVVKRSFTYTEYFAAFYSAFVNRLIWSTTGYIILYMTLAIAIDRLIAFHCGAHYNRFNQRRVALKVIFVVIAISLVFNSWEAPLENRIETSLISSDQLLGEHLSAPSANATNVTLYALKPRTGPAEFVLMRKIKNWYNFVLRLCYPFALAALTAAVIWGFWKQRKIRRRYSVHRNERQERKDKNLFYLLLFNVLLAFLQVIPKEARRILEITYPYADLMKQVDDEMLPLATRLYLLDIMYYGHVCGKIVANLCTFINRSMNFYLYVCFNSAFRAEVCKIMCQSKNAKLRRGFSRFEVSLKSLASHTSLLNHTTMTSNGCSRSTSCKTMQSMKV